MKTFITIIGIFCFISISTAQNKLSDHDRELAENLQTVEEAPDRLALINQIVSSRKWRIGDTNSASWRLLVGRVKVDPPDDPTNVIAQMLILKDGYFGTQIKDMNRPLTFRMDGYEPLDVDFSHRDGQIIDLGTLKMTKLSPSDERYLKGRLVTESPADYPKASVELSALQGAVNSPFGMYSNRPHWPQPLKLIVSNDGTFSRNGISPISYYCTIKVPGYTDVEEPLSFTSPSGVDLGTLTLERPKKIQLTAVVSTNLVFDFTKLVKTNLTADSDWRYISLSRYDPRHPPAFINLYLRLRQTDGELWFKSYIGPAQMSDLGPGTLEAMAKQVTGNEAGSKPETIQLKGGHVYLLKVGGGGSTWLLFKIEDVS